jgi:hypothetical protein
MRFDDADAFYYLECATHQFYLAHTIRSEFLLKYSHRLHTSVTPIVFTSLEDALEYASKQTNRKRMNLAPRPVGDFLSQFIAGQAFEVQS